MTGRWSRPDCSIFTRADRHVPPSGQSEQPFRLRREREYARLASLYRPGLDSRSYNGLVLTSRPDASQECLRSARAPGSPNAIPQRSRHPRGCQPHPQPWRTSSMGGGASSTAVTLEGAAWERLWPIRPRELPPQERRNNARILNLRQIVSGATGARLTEHKLRLN